MFGWNAEVSDEVPPLGRVTDDVNVGVSPLAATPSKLVGADIQTVLYYCISHFLSLV